MSNDIKLKIEASRLDDKLEGSFTLQGEAFAYTTIIGGGYNPNYTVFVDTSDQDNLFVELTKDFPKFSDWGEQLRRAYELDPSLKERLSIEQKYKVPPELLLAVGSNKGGGHGDLELRFKKSLLTFLPVRDYNLLKPRLYPGGGDGWCNCKALYERGKFLIGTNEDLKSIGVEILPRGQ
ncbi:MAG TPA: hypothetical protein VJC39_00765 [Candidatus Nanoarchaeia archaeon]|nr:hypothetical protein [Candidatus Nanoarchaeia archaeon]